MHIYMYVFMWVCVNIEISVYEICNYALFLKKSDLRDRCASSHNFYHLPRRLRKYTETTPKRSRCMMKITAMVP